MLFEYPLTIHAGTTEAAPEELTAPLAPGTIAKVSVDFPPGCRGLAHVAIWRSEHQVWPGNLDGDIAADGLVVEWPDDYDLDDEPYDLTLKGWSPSATFPHTIIFRFAVLPLSVKEEAGALARLLRRIADFLGLGA